MKVQFVFASFLVCTLLGELFGQAVEDSDDVLQDNMGPVSISRSSTYNSGCAYEPDRTNIAYTRVRYPRTSVESVGRKANKPNRNVQFPRYRNVNHMNLPACSSDLLRSRFRTNINSRPRRYRNDPRCLNKAVVNFGLDGQYYGKIPRNTAKKRDYLQKLLRNKKARQMFRRMIEIDDAEEDDGVDVLDG